MPARPHKLTLQLRDQRILLLDRLFECRYLLTQSIDIRAAAAFGLGKLCLQLVKLEPCRIGLGLKSRDPLLLRRFCVCKSLVFLSETHPPVKINAAEIPKIAISVEVRIIKSFL